MLNTRSLIVKATKRLKTPTCYRMHKVTLVIDFVMGIIQMQLTICSPAVSSNIRSSDNIHVLLDDGGSARQRTYLVQL